MKFAEKNDSLFLPIIFTFLFYSSSDEITFIKQISILEIFIWTILFYTTFIFILLLTKHIKHYTILSLILLFTIKFLVVSNYYIGVHHYFTSKEIEIDATVAKIHQAELKEMYKDEGVFFDTMKIIKYIVFLKKEIPL